MRGLVLAVALLLTTTAPGDVVCRIGTTHLGSLADLAATQAAHERQAAESAGQAHPTGAPALAPWVGLVRCSQSGS